MNSPDDDHIRCGIESIGPDEAATILERNDKNRSQRARNIEKFARDMAAGRWVLNGETIVIADSGRLLNGQNRLLAVVKSAVTIRVIVVRGVPEAAFKTIDQGAKRTIGDVLGINGELHAKNLASSAGHLWRFQTFPKERFSASATPTEAEVEAILESYPGLRDSIKFTLTYKVSGLALSRAAVLHFLFAERDSADADDFFMALSTGANLGASNPILKLRELLVANQSGKRKMPLHELMAVVIKAWNLYRDSRDVGGAGLRWRSQGPAAEPFPEPI